MINRFIPSPKYLRRVALGLFLFLVLLILIVGTSIYKISKAGDRLDLMANDLTVKLATLDTMIDGMKDVEIYSRNIILESDENDMQNEYRKILVARSLYDDAESRLDALFTSSKDKELLNKIRELRVATRPLINHAIELGWKNQDRAATAFLIKNTVPLIRERRALLEQLRIQQKAAIDLAKEEATSAHTQAGVLIFILGILLVAASLALSVMAILLFLSIGVLQTLPDQNDAS